LFSLQFFQKQLQAMIEQTTRNQVSVTKQVELGMAIPAPEEQSASKLVQRIERSEPQLAQLAVDARSASERIRAAIFTTSVRMAAFVRGRPGRSRAQRRAHWRRNQWRCQSTTVSGSTDDQGCSPIPPRV